jgi:hypothetical protein
MIILWAEAEITGCPGARGNDAILSKGQYLSQASGLPGGGGNRSSPLGQGRLSIPPQIKSTGCVILPPR